MLRNSFSLYLQTSQNNWKLRIVARVLRACVCVCARARARVHGVRVCVCVCVCEREREREKTNCKYISKSVFFSTSTRFAVTCRARSRRTGTAVLFARHWNTLRGSLKQRGWLYWNRAAAGHLRLRSKRSSRGRKTSLTAPTRVTSTERTSSYFATARN